MTGGREGGVGEVEGEQGEVEGEQGRSDMGPVWK